MKNETANLMPAHVIALARFSQAALVALNARLFTLVAMLLAFGLFAWSALDPHWIRFATACAFAVLVFYPVHRMEQNKVVNEGGENG